MTRIGLLFALCLFILLITQAHHVFVNAAWIQTDGNGFRSRYAAGNLISTNQRGYSLSNDQTSKLIPSSIFMDLYWRVFCGLGNNGQQVLCMSIQGDKKYDGQVVPNAYELVDVLPVMDGDFHYYTVRRNVTSGTYFVLKSVLSRGSQPWNQILFDTLTNTGIHNMIYTDYGLIIASGDFLINVDKDNGKGNWNVNLGIGLQNAKFLYNDQFTYILYILYPASVDRMGGIMAIDLRTGSIVKRENLFITKFAPQSFLMVGKNYLAIPDTTHYNSIFVLSKSTLKLVEIVELKGKNEGFSLDRCSNIISMEDDSFFLKCLNSDSSYSALKYEIIGNKVSLAYEINTNSLFGIPPRVCTNQIAAYKSGFAMACDVGLFVFHFKDNVVIPRIEIDNFKITPDTQIFGSDNGFALVNGNNEMTLIGI